MGTVLPLPGSDNAPRHRSRCRSCLEPKGVMEVYVKSEHFTISNTYGEVEATFRGDEARCCIEAGRGMRVPRIWMSPVVKTEREEEWATGLCATWSLHDLSEAEIIEIRAKKTEGGELLVGTFFLSGAWSFCEPYENWLPEFWQDAKVLGKIDLYNDHRDLLEEATAAESEGVNEINS